MHVLVPTPCPLEDDGRRFERPFRLHSAGAFPGGHCTLLARNDVSLLASKLAHMSLPSREASPRGSGREKRGPHHIAALYEDCSKWSRKSAGIGF